MKCCNLSPKTFNTWNKSLQFYSIFCCRLIGVTKFYLDFVSQMEDVKVSKNFED